MNFISRRLSAFLPFLLFLSGCAQHKSLQEIIGYQYADNDRTLLWEISGNGLKEPSYLYGTIHIQRKEVFAYDTIVQTVFDSCQAYAMELNMDDINPFKMAKMMTMEKGLDELISPEKYRVLDSMYEAATGSHIGIMKNTKPFFLMSQLELSKIGGDMPLALDLHFFQQAKQAKKKVIGIEKLEDQLNAIDQLTIDEQVDMIMEGLKDTTSQMSKFDEMLQTYLAGDLEKMLELTNDSTAPPVFTKAFLWDRNIHMADRIAEISKEQITFNAIGAGHLGGEKGVIALLRQKGFTVRPIKTKFKSVNE